MNESSILCDFSHHPRSLVLRQGEPGTASPPKAPQGGKGKGRRTESGPERVRARFFNMTLLDLGMYLQHDPSLEVTSNLKNPRAI